MPDSRSGQYQPSESGPVAKPGAAEHELNAPLASVANLEVWHLLHHLLSVEGSDLHFTVDSPLLNRIHGDLVPVLFQGKRLQATGQDSQRILKAILSEDQKQRLDDELDIDFAYAHPQLSARFRCNYYHASGKLEAVFRQIPNEIKTLDELMMPDVLRTLCDLPRGLVLVVGPTGSGKSTTLAAMIDYINTRRQSKIITIEDPVEFVHQPKRCGISQREVHLDVKSFSRGVRAALREDPDVVLVGEMRDTDTVREGVRAADTGHLVFATLHTNNASETVDRLINQFPGEERDDIRSKMALILQGVVSQKLVKTKDGRGRRAALEVMTSTDSVRSLIRDGESQQLYSEIMTGSQFGMQTLEQSLAALVVDGVVERKAASEQTPKLDQLDRAITDIMRRKNG